MVVAISHPQSPRSHDTHPVPGRASFSSIRNIGTSSLEKNTNLIGGGGGDSKSDGKLMHRSFPPANPVLLVCCVLCHLPWWGHLVSDDCAVQTVTWLIPLGCQQGSLQSMRNQAQPLGASKLPPPPPSFLSLRSHLVRGTHRREERGKMKCGNSPLVVLWPNVLDFSWQRKQTIQFDKRNREQWHNGVLSRNVLCVLSVSTVMSNSFNYEQNTLESSRNVLGGNERFGKYCFFFFLLNPFRQNCRS